MGGSAYIDGKEYPEFDNFYKCQFVHNNRTWTSSEQCYQAMKFTDLKKIDKIHEQTTAIDSWIVGNNLELDINNWEEVKVNCMYNANYEKFKQNKDLLDLLLDTKGSIAFLGSTPFWNKKNAEILECLRIELDV